MLTKLASKSAPGGSGWKVIGRNGELATLYLGKVPLPEGEWMTDPKTGTLEADDGQEYETGFHLFREREAAKALLDSCKGCYPSAVVAVVDYRSVTATGEDSWRGVMERWTGKPNALFQTVVAREICIGEVVYG